MADLPAIARGTPDQIRRANDLRSAWLRRHQRAAAMPRELRLVLLGLTDANWWIRNDETGPDGLTSAIRQRLGPHGHLLGAPVGAPQPRTAVPVQRAKPPVQPAPTAPPRDDDEDWDLGGAKEPYTYTAGFAFIGRDKRPQVRIDCYVGDEWVSEYGYRFTNREVTEPTDRRVTWAIKQLGFRIERGSTWKKVEHEEWMIDVEETGEPGVGSFPKVQSVDEVVSRILR